MATMCSTALRAEAPHSHVRDVGVLVLSLLLVAAPLYATYLTAGIAAVST